MTTILLVVGYLVLLSVVMTTSGWCLAAIARIKPLCHSVLESRIECAFMGTGFWVLLYGACSHLGFAFSEVRWHLLAVFCGLIAVGVIRSRPSIPIRRAVPVDVWIFAVACTLAIGLIFWPLFYCSFVWPFNDTLNYCHICQWLLGHGFKTSLDSIDSRVMSPVIVVLGNQSFWRMGAMFLQTLVAGYTGLDPILAFPIVMAWGMVLNLGGILLLARSTFGLKRRVAMAAVLTAAVALNPLYTSVYWGFLSQVFGTAYLSLVIALLSQATSPRFWKASNAFRVALHVAAFVSLYSEMAPILALVGLAYVILMLSKNGNTPDYHRYLRFVALTLFGLLVLGNIEWWRSWQCIVLQSGISSSRVGWAIDWLPWEFWSFAIGQRPTNFGRAPRLALGYLILQIVMSFLFLVGATLLFRSKRTAIAGFAILIFLAITFYFSHYVQDPFTGKIGHRWNLFKIAKWSFPLLLTIQFAGLSLFSRHARHGTMLCFLPALVALFVSFNFHRSHTVFSGSMSQKLFHSAEPLHEWQKLRVALAETGTTAIYLVQKGDAVSPELLLPYALYPMPFVNGWKGTHFEGIRSNDPPFCDPGVTVLMCGKLPFRDEGIALPANVTQLDGTRPCVFHFDNPAGPPQIDEDGIYSAEFGDQSATLWIWSPCAGVVRFTAETQSEIEGTMNVVLEDGKEIHEPLATKLELDVPVQGGRNHFTLSISANSLKRIHIRNVNVRLEAPGTRS